MSVVPKMRKRIGKLRPSGGALSERARILNCYGSMFCYTLGTSEPWQCQQSIEENIICSKTIRRVYEICHSQDDGRSEDTLFNIFRPGRKSTSMKRRCFPPLHPDEHERLETLQRLNATVLDQAD